MDWLVYIIRCGDGTRSEAAREEWVGLQISIACNGRFDDYAACCFS